MNDKKFKNKDKLSSEEMHAKAKELSTAFYTIEVTGEVDWIELVRIARK